MLDQKQLQEFYAQNSKQQIENTNSVEDTVVIRNITDWKPTTNGLPRKMVITENKGNFWVLASSIRNLPSSFTQPVPGKATFTLRKDAAGTERINMSRLEFAGLENETALMIREMPAGTALFASSK